MIRSRAEYLINKLIISDFSKSELDEFLAGIGSKMEEEKYSFILAEYFEKLVQEQRNEPLNEAEVKWLSTLDKDYF